MPFSEEFGRDFLRQGCPRYSDQSTMQEFEFSRVEAAFRHAFPQAADIIANYLVDQYPTAEAAEQDSSAGGIAFKPTEGDERERLFRQIRARRGQQEFRQKLRARYSDCCLISGCRVLDVLEAAHIRPYRGERDNHEENGLLLRADVHTLFDLNLIGIDPATFRIHLHPEVDKGEYQALQGRTLSCTVENRPSVEALTMRWEAFKKRVHG